jgi:hypothetical protein
MGQVEGSAPEAVYIAGYGRSGSTLLDMLFDQMDGVFGAGELTHVFTDWRLRNRCSCGEALVDCDFWSQVFPLWEREGYPNEEAEILTRRVEISRLHRSGWRPRRRLMNRYGPVWRAMFQAIRTVSSASTIVDSSKTMGLMARRQAALTTELGGDVATVQLVRDPRAVFHSVAKGRGPSVGAPRRRPQGAVLLGSATWSLANSSAASNRRQASRSSLVKYEDLVQRPHDVMTRLAVALGIEGIAPSLRLPLEPGHGVRGNRMRRSGVASLQADDEWLTSELGTLHRIASAIAWPVAIRYGYNTLGASQASRRTS